MNPLRPLVVAAQGWWVRRTIHLLPPAGGPASGLVGDSLAEPLRIAVVGESTAAGAGVAVHQDGFAGALAHGLAESTGRAVLWSVVGQFGATARRIRHRLIPQLGPRYDLVVLLAGANDVLSGRSAAEWRADLTAILDLLALRSGRTIVVGTPPFASFPSLPRTLRRHLAESGQALDEVARQVCATREDAEWMPSADDQVGPDFFAADGFHPSAIGYRRWAELVREKVEASSLAAAPPAAGEPRPVTASESTP
ncbi:SGNH/GDSL hydrolase family protein [Microbacterium sp. CFH 90308]|uniref:SGNH/GDSL hydrolase family protein n=1 Tax=Microbacterium salsuginis TaxID=2722803 RepID=A0ABX1KE20_9MICO|nr:SGNH/GDSL hydrolase family protein [Microbacterium sp. CFH 90308]NLP85287.1 SGNH/GDSL hydrolase family protein [Microbacterium sp. CFH 90308]